MSRFFIWWQKLTGYGLFQYFVFLDLTVQVYFCRKIFIPPQGMLNSSLTVAWFPSTNHNYLLRKETNKFASFCIDSRLGHIAIFVLLKWTISLLSSYVERCFLLYKTNTGRFHVVMRLFSNRPQMSKCGMNFSDTLGYCLVCNFFLMPSVIHCRTDTQQWNLLILLLRLCKWAASQ